MDTEEIDTKKPYAVVVLVQVIYAVMYLLTKAAFDSGLNNFILVFYRQATATIVLAPFAFYCEWKTAPSLSFVTFCKIFVISLLGITATLDIYGVALMYTSATLVAATMNCVPVITFFLAVLLRMETLRLRTTSGLAKLLGVMVCLGGAATLAFCKGPHIKLWCHHFVLYRNHNMISPSHPSSGIIWVKGCFLMLSSNFCWASWIVLQGRIIKSYPSKLMLTTLQCFLSSIQSFVIAISVVRDRSQWELGWNIRLLTVAYCGIAVTGLTYYLQAWVIEKRGPVFLAMSTPLALIITIIFSAFVLCEALTLGSILGGVLLVGGLYSFLWGKNREQVLDQGSCKPPEVQQECSQFKEEEASHKSPELLIQISHPTTGKVPN